MAELIQIVVERLDQSGSVVKRNIVGCKEIQKPETIIDIGLRHSEQIAVIAEIQDTIIEAQISHLNNTEEHCPKCGTRLAKKGYTKSDFNSIFTDHKIGCSRKVCYKCKWTSIPSIRSIFGTQIHPDLAKLQVELSGSYPYRSAQKILNTMVNRSRSINNHNGLKQLTESVSQYIETYPEPVNDNIAPSDNLIVQVDGGHVKTTEDQRSIEAMTSVVYNPKNVNYYGGNEKKSGGISEIRGEITSKSCAASALSDNQKSIKSMTIRAAKLQGMTKATKITALCDGASNCWSVVEDLENKCSSINRILDWFHIGMKFKNTGLGDKTLNERLDSAKWYLWRGNATKGIERLSSLCDELKNDAMKLNKVKKLKTYIENNKEYIVHYLDRKENDLIFTSNMAEATVESLINQRCKSKQHMRWSRGGLHAILIVRSAVNSDQWADNWEKQITGALKNAA
jgi:hypothetical protein